MPVARTRQDRAADVAILPEVDPSLRDLVGCRLVENVGLGGGVEGDVRDPIELLVIDGQIDLLYWNRSEPDITRTSIGRREDCGHGPADRTTGRICRADTMGGRSNGRAAPHEAGAAGYAGRHPGGRGEACNSPCPRSYGGGRRH